MKKIYLAGPEVFKVNAKEIGSYLVKKCEEHGYKGLFPLDNEIAAGSKASMSKAIFLANKKMIEECDIVVANLNDWRGKEPDSGTVWECGYASALGKRVIAYMDSTSPYLSKFDLDIKISESNGFMVTLDENDLIIEDFDNPLNLMLAESVEKIIEGDIEEVFKYLSLN